MDAVMEREKVFKYAYYLVYLLLGILFLLFVLAAAVLEYNKNPSVSDRQKALVQIYGFKPPNQNLPSPWPPVMNAAFPDIPLIDSSGAELKVSDFKGKVIIVEYIDMTSPVSHSYSGAKARGPYGGARHTFDESVSSLEETVSKENQGQLSLPNPDIIVIKIIVFNEAGQQAKVDDALAWAGHFGFTRENNYIVSVPQKDLRDKLTDKIVPGFQLIDKQFLLRVDSAGPEPKHSLQFRLVTMIPTLLAAELEE